MKTLLTFLLVTLMASSASAATPKPKAKPTAKELQSSDKNTAGVNGLLDAWHQAAAVPDEKKYFGMMAASMVFLGTDPLERWTKEEFRAYAHPHFAKGKGWEIRAMKRNIAFSADKKTAWFDEDAVSTGLGPVRGSGVLVKEKGKWLVAQYNLSVPIYNERFDEVRKINVPPKADK